MNPFSHFQLLWQQSDLTLKLVATLLLIMSIASWFLIIRHGLRLWQLKRAARAMDAFWHENSFDRGLMRLEEAGNSVANPYRQLALSCQLAVLHHRENQEDLHGQLSLADWLNDSLSGAIDDALEPLQSGLSVLASVGSTAPFIGLFGTVWGIYHALLGMGRGATQSLDQVAGPIGETLIMTAIGLAVAIPAVLGYNALTRLNRGIFNRLQRFARQLHAYALTGSAMMPTRQQAS